MPIVADLAEYHRRYSESLSDPQAFWLGEAAALQWMKPPERAFDGDISEVDLVWFPGGQLNLNDSCVDRHALATPDRTAILWVGNDPGQTRKISYAELRREVGRLANLLLSLGIRKGDRVALYMPMIPELAFAMLACARIGAVHSVVFGGFSAIALRERIVDAQARVVITANEGLRGAKPVPLKEVLDEALTNLDLVHTVLVAKRTPHATFMKPGRDHWLSDAMATARPYCPCTAMDAEDPLFILYTSGSTGRPKGVLHTTGGYLTYAAATFRWVFDVKPGADLWFCTADLGWITGHSYLLYGPLANGVTTLMFEGVPTYPDAGRFWEIVAEHRVTHLYTAPTALRALMRFGDDVVRAHDRSSLRVLGTVGEPINPEVWRWYHEVVGESRCSVVDTWWQTETGGILISPIPGVTPTKPGSATRPLFGVQPVLVDDKGHELTGNAVSGNLCLKGAWPGQARTLHGDHRRFCETYYRPYPGYYFTGDGCRRDADGDYWITGRVDDVVNVSGHRIGTAEVESALVAHDAVVEAAVVGYPHAIKGQAIRAYVILRPHVAHPETLVGSMQQHVRHTIGSLAVPDQILIVPGLPKTRSGKIMRRILRKIAEGETESLGDVSTLAEPHVVDEIIELAKRLQ